MSYPIYCNNFGHDNRHIILSMHTGSSVLPNLGGCIIYCMGLPSVSVVKNPPVKQEMGLRHRFGKIPWRRKCDNAPLFLPEKSHGQRSLAGYIQPLGSLESGLTTKPPPPPHPPPHTHTHTDSELGHMTCFGRWNIINHHNKGL